MLEETLATLESRRLGYKERRARIEEELRQRRIAMLAEEQGQIENLVAKAVAEGATLGQIKRAYKTKDHRTITTMVAENEAAIRYWREFLAAPENGDWFTIVDDDNVLIGEVTFRLVTMETGEIMLTTETPQWNEDFTIENETVRDFDGKTEDESDRVREIADALRERT